MKKSLIAAAMLLCGVGTASAQSLPFLNLTQDAYTMGMGGATLAFDANAFTVTTNTAAITLSDKTMSAGINYMMWQPSAAKNSLVGASAFYKINDRWGVSINGKYFGYKKINGSSTEGIAGEAFTPYDFAAEAGVSFRIIDGLAVGANFRYIGSKLYKDMASAFSADISLMYKYKDLNVAVAATNIGTKIKYGFTAEDLLAYDLPGTAKIGAAYNFNIAENHRISASVEGDYLFYANEFAAGVGAEYSFNEMVFARGGYHYGNSMNTIPSFGSVGIGAKIFGATINAAYIIAGNDSPLKNTFNISIGYEF